MRNIVIIDDDLNLLEGMRHSIPWHLLNVNWVGEGIDGQEGLRTVRELMPDIVLTDINMPEMNGLDMIAALRGEGFRGKFIILSGYADFEYARQAVRLQVDDYLSKPVTLESLQKVIARVLKDLDQDRMAESEHMKLQERLNRYKPYVIKDWLSSIVTGGEASYADGIAEIQDQIRKWTGSIHRGLLIDVASDGNWEMLERQRSLLRFAIRNVTCEFVQDRFPQYEFIELQSDRYAVILTEPAGDGGMDRLERFGPQLREHLETYLQTKLKVRAAVELAPVVRDWERLTDSFRPLLLSSETSDSALVLGDNIRHRQYVDQVIKYIEQYYAEPLTLGFLADEIQISKNYLGQIFRSLVGETFNQYVTRVRMEKAKQMILEGKDYIYEVAQKVGYANIPYFSSQFKKYTGMNPADLLKGKAH